MPKVTRTYYNQPIDDLQFVLEMMRHCIPPTRFDTLNHPYVYGGYVRDTLRGQPFQDMDIRVSSLEMAETFIQFLERSKRIISLERRIFTESDIPDVDYQSFSLIIQTPNTDELKIDITYSHASVLEEDSLNNCDFTANNLMMDSSGNIYTRIKAYQIGKAREYTDAQWTAKCIRDCMEGNLVWMIPDRFSRVLTSTAVNSFMEKMNMQIPHI